jgi:transmembrane sensor
MLRVQLATSNALCDVAPFPMRPERDQRCRAFQDGTRSATNVVPSGMRPAASSAAKKSSKENFIFFYSYPPHFPVFSIAPVLYLLIIATAAGRSADVTDIVQPPNTITMDDAKRLTYLFRRYFDKTCTPAEQDELFALLLRSEHDETLKRLIEETWSRDIPDYSQSDYRADKILRHIISRQSPEVTADPSSPRSPNPQRLRSFHYLRYAAVLTAVTLVSFLLYYHHRPATPIPPPIAAATAVPPVTDSCLTLPDGSKVLLHKGARVDYETAFANTTREVTLHGEAYFDIRHDPRPFIVHTGSIRTTVLGTAFNINVHDERTITITVTRGKVKVENGAGEFSILRRNEQISVDSLHTRLKKTQVDAGEVLVWKKPYVLFNDVTMKEAMQELAQRYHVSVVFTNPAAENCPVTASFIGGESLEEMIKVLSKINNMEYTIGHNTVEITGEGCK